VYSRSGHLLFVKEGVLMAQPFDAGALRLTGVAARVAELNRVPEWNNFSVSDDGTLVYRRGISQRTQNSELTWFDRSGKALGTIGPAGQYQTPELSWDGKFVAFSRDRDIWVMDLERGSTTRLTLDAAQNLQPRWSLDGRTIAYQSSRGGAANVYVGAPGIAGEHKPLTSREDNVGTLLDSLGEGARRFLAVGRTEPADSGTNPNVWAFPLDGDRKPMAVAVTPFAEVRARIAPNGRWIGIESNESGAYEIYVQPFPQPGRKIAVSNEAYVGGSGLGPRWRHDSQEIYYVSPRGRGGEDEDRLMAVSLNTRSGAITATSPAALFSTPFNMTWPNLAGVSPDGRFLVAAPATQAGESTPPPITVVINFAARLEKKRGQ
jgi:dipeptidyl aminopeptidase/acylaminoacyl peptidase